MTPFNPELFLSTLALIAAVIIVSALLSGMIEKSGFPQVAVFLALGALIGPSGLGLVNANAHSPIVRVVASLSLVLVLFTDALSINLAEVRRNRLLSALVLGPGTLVSAFLIAALAWWWLGLNPAAALILGAALASTDPVLLRGLIRRPGVGASVRQALRLEGGMNDAVLLPMVLVGMTILGQGHALGGQEWARLAMNILILSPAAGAVIGLAAVGMLQMVRQRIGVRRDYESIYSLGVAFAAFAAAETVHGSGFLAAFAAGLTISAIDVELCDCFLEYGETTAEMALMFTFVLFGTSMIWTGLSVAGWGTLLFTAAVFLARMAAFLPALLPARLPWRDRLLIAWFGPRGLSSLLLVLLPVFAGLPGAEDLLTTCCLVVLCSVMLHGLSPVFLIKAPAPAKARPIPEPALPRELPPAICSIDGVPCELPQILPDPEYITLEEVQRLQQNTAARMVVVDARSERTYGESTEEIPGAIRLHPDRAVQAARQYPLSKDAVLAVLCA
ncbi:MAG TPA: cation:proton antiporter [Bryobacteraceae bacterium]|nr:cation:proton antiporter [Bryobacteraceae bacterium]